MIKPCIDVQREFIYRMDEGDLSDRLWEFLDGVCCLLGEEADQKDFSYPMYFLIADDDNNVLRSNLITTKEDGEVIMETGENNMFPSKSQFPFPLIAVLAIPTGVVSHTIEMEVLEHNKKFRSFRLYLTKSTKEKEGKAFRLAAMRLAAMREGKVD